MYNKILVPLDGSELAERALPLAFHLVQQSEGEVVLVRALTPDRVMVPDALSGYGLLWPEKPLEDARTEARTYLSHWRAKAPAGARVRYVLAEGSAAETITETASEEKADLIVMSSHGYSGLTRWMLGSVAERVLHATQCPVLVLRGEAKVKHILLPLDGSDLSEQALRPALDVAEAQGAKVTLLRAIRTVPLTDIEALNSAERGLGQRYTEELVREAQDYLDFKVRTIGRPGVEIHAVVTPEPPAEAILNYTERHPIDLIAMSTHGRTGLSRWMYGSVTEKVLRVSHRSMLVVRP